MAHIQWGGYEWRPREKWGVYHPEKTYCNSDGCIWRLLLGNL